MNKFKDKAIEFLEGRYYPLLVFLCTLISHTLSIELFGACVILSSAFFGFIFCRDLKFLISPLFMFIFTFSEKSVSSGKYYGKAYVIAMILVACALVGVVIAHFVIHKNNVSLKAFYKSKLFWGIAALCASFLLNGIFTNRGYEVSNITFALILTASLALVFFLFSINLNCGKDTLDYILYIMYLTSILLTLEMLLSFTGQIRFENGEIVKESILVGWGMWNNIGGMLAYLLPIHFYFAATSKKFGYIFYISGVISYFTIALTLSRSSLLFSSVIIVISALCACFLGDNKKTNRIITVSVAILGVVGIIVLWDKISSILGDYLSRGFDDNGRFDIYRHGLKNFLENPIFGGGFDSAYVLDHQFVFFLPYRYHNTIIQMMGTCGSVGIAAYVYHRYQTVRLLWEKRSLKSLYLGLCILSMLLCSLLDNHFFNIYPLFFYSVILVAIEKNP